MKSFLAYPMSLPQHPFTQLEHDVLAFWDQEKIFQKSLDQRQDGPSYCFYDGPPFATGRPHHGHLLASTIKDIFPRYYTMRGYHVPRRFGWDCHGLPIEHEINKSLGMHAHEALESLGLRGYNDACRNIVMRYREEWKHVIRRLGRWVDMENDYKTMDVVFMESVWWVFSELWKKNRIYKGHKVVAYSPALETVLSNFEASSNHHVVQDPSVIIEFQACLPFMGEELRFLAWTTTPWTLPANLALCVNPEALYARVRLHDRPDVTFLVAEARRGFVFEKHPHEVLSEHPGSAFLGMSYFPLFPETKPEEDGTHVVLMDAYVTLDVGTGIVHQAPAFGEDDQRVCAQYGIHALPDPLDLQGRFDSTLPWLTGKSFKEADAPILKHLKQCGMVFSHQTLEHAYPFCPRSDQPLMYRAIPSWYLAIGDLKPLLLEINQATHWVPLHVRDGRFGQWLANAKDWAISRNRVWGTPLPLWVNDVTGKIICMSGREELQQYTGQWVEDLHRESIDALVFKLPSEPGEYRRIPEVLDCWFESGAMPWAQQGYPWHSQKAVKDFFPADFIAEGLDQTRGWFYTLTVLAAALEKAPAFKNVIVNGIITAEDGKKMSKRLKNYTDPLTLMETHSADALRLYMIHSGLVKAEEQRFSDAGVAQILRKVLLPWYNAVHFFETYAALEQWQQPSHMPEGELLDQWIRSRLAHLIEKIETAMAQYRLDLVLPALLSGLEELTNTYIRMNRQRFWGTESGYDHAAFATLFEVLWTLTLCLAPFAPLTAEGLYQKLKRFAPNASESVHLCDYPTLKTDWRNEALDQAVEWMQRIIVLGRHQRNQAKIALKTPLKTLTIIHHDPIVLTSIARLEPWILGELNMQKIEYTNNAQDAILLIMKPNARALGQRFGQGFTRIWEAMKALSQEAIAQAEHSARLTILGEELHAGDFLIERKPLTDDVMSDGLITLKMDLSVDREAEIASWIRSLIGFVQRQRKQHRLQISDRIAVKLYVPAEWVEHCLRHQAHIFQETLIIQWEVHPNNQANCELNEDQLAMHLMQTHANHGD